MQHHSHAPRPSHMRAHHMHQQAAAPPPPQVMHATVAPTSHITMNLGPPPPSTAPQQQNAPQTATATSHQQHQHQQQQQQQPAMSHHVNNGPTLTLPIATNTQQLQSGKSHYMQPSVHGNRLSQHHPQQQQHHLMQAQQQQQIQRVNPQAIHTTAQMQKIRQQHQLLNNNNNSTNSHQQQQQQQQQQHMGVQQHQRNIHHASHHIPLIKLQQQQQQQQQHHHLPQQHVQQTQHPTPVSILKQHTPQHQHVIPTTAAAAGVQQIPPEQQQQTQLQQHCYTGGGGGIGNKTKYSNSSTVAAAASVPKKILQNPNRSHKINQQNVIPITTDLPVAGSAALQMNAHVGEAVTIVTPVVSAKSPEVTTAATANTALQDKIVTSISEDCEHATECPSEANKENTTPSNNNCDELPSDNVLSCDDTNSGNGSKEKTPMCLVNELARYNKITHQYRLTNEKGPAHCKRFTVTLKLGDEEYSAEGYKIKKAQHLAAAEAIEKTKYKHPVPKIIRRTDECSSRATITPTVELNALAMKLGQQTYYLFDPRQQPPSDTILSPSSDIVYGGGMPPPPPPPMHGSSAHAGPPMMPPPPPPHHMLDVNLYMRRNTGPYAPNQRFPHHRGYPPHPSKFAPHQRYPLMSSVMAHNGGMPPHLPHGSYAPHSSYPTTLCKITLIVGKQKFVGTGRTLQAAKHDAASRALQVLKTQAANKLNEILNRSIEESDSKSPISLVHEIGIKRNMTVQFKVLREEGPAHMKNFITACVVGHIVTEGEGNGKKISKKRAADKMLEELKKLPPLSPTKSPVKRIKVKAPSKAVTSTGQIDTKAGGKAGGAERKKRTGGASIKEKSENDNVDSDNPISKLIVLLQSRKEKEPVYELISKNGNENSRRCEFVIKVSAAGSTAHGTGNNKKLAKRNAAQNLLDALCTENSAAAGQVALGQTIEEKQPPDPMDKTENSTTEVVTKTNEVKSTAATQLESIAVPLVKTTAGQVPGILILRQNRKSSAGKNTKNIAGTAATPSGINITATNTKDIASSNEPAPTQTLLSSTSASTITSTAVVQTSEATGEIVTSDDALQNTESPTSTNASNATTSSTGLHMKNQLLYLAQLLGFEVNFSDYPKGNHNDFLTIVTLSTTPAQICHGTGANAEESQNDAAKNALKILSKLGLNNVKSN